MRELSIAYGNSRNAKVWTNKTITWENLKIRLRNPLRTAETVEAYKTMKKADRDMAKDHGGFVAGLLKEGKRQIDHVLSRSMITLDGDSLTKDFVCDFARRMPYASLLYSTHSSTPEAPRARIIVPLSRDVAPEEFIAVSRYLAKELGMDMFDVCSYRANQLMYWPSCPMDGEYLFYEVGKPWMNPDALLSLHPEWRDPTLLPTSSREITANDFGRKEVQDPLTKDGIVGVFNRTYYPIQKAIDVFLSDVYEPSADPDRYHYIPSDSGPGVVIKQDGKFIYSHHASDPACMKLYNAFDIVRIHKFGLQDEKASFTKMADLAVRDAEVKLQIFREKNKGAAEDFREEPPAGNDAGSTTAEPIGVISEDDWRKKLTYNPKVMRVENTLQNLVLILQNDPLLTNIVFNRLNDGLEIIGEVPWNHPSRFWRDADDAQLICYLDETYGTFSQRNYMAAIAKVADDRSYHPICSMFESLPGWDGEERAEKLLIEYLGAEDNEYVRAVTKKTLCAAYMRVYHPGIKFDYILVLNGPQGIGKSTLISKLGMKWYSDSLAVSDMNDKTAAEKLQGYWIQEISEMAGMKKADLERVKAFISRQDDSFRASFGRRVTPHPRQCVFFGTTNSEKGYLRDITGNRRFWNVRVSGQGVRKPWELDEETIRQVWAEVKEIAGNGEPLYLSYNLEKLARIEQRMVLETDDREGLIRAYLERLLPEDWYDWDIYKRRNYIRDPEDPTQPVGKNQRMHVSNLEIWVECLGKQAGDLRMADSYSLTAVMQRIEGWEKDGTCVRDKVYGRQRVYIREQEE
ncbi:MAG: hypothetical protein IKQ49_04430 [Eubacterium sp.]|nr:hypothetical protein [Eubacterium sp.]